MWVTIKYEVPAVADVTAFISENDWMVKQIIGGEAAGSGYFFPTRTRDMQFPGPLSAEVVQALRTAGFTVEGDD